MVVVSAWQKRGGGKQHGNGICSVVLAVAARWLRVLSEGSSAAGAEKWRAAGGNSNGDSDDGNGISNGGSGSDGDSDGGNGDNYFDSGGDGDSNWGDGTATAAVVAMATVMAATMAATMTAVAGTKTRWQQ